MCISIKVSNMKRELLLMDKNLQQELFGNSYLLAITSVAGFSASKPSEDLDSIDYNISVKGDVGRKFRSPQIDIQMKTTKNIKKSSDGKSIKYSLNVKNYSELRGGDYHVPRILVLVTVPEEVENWITQKEEELILRKCAYWVSLAKSPETKNSSSVTIDIPISQKLNVDSIKKLLYSVADGVIP